MKFSSLQTRFTFLGCMAAFAVLMVGGLNYYISTGIKHDTEKEKAFTILKESILTADMTTDEIRSDVYDAVYSGSHGNRSAAEQASQQLAGEIGPYEAIYTRLLASNPPADLNKLVIDAQKALKDYKSAAQAVMTQSAAIVDPAETSPSNSFNQEMDAIQTTMPDGTSISPDAVISLAKEKFTQYSSQQNQAENSDALIAPLLEDFNKKFSILDEINKKIEEQIQTWSDSEKGTFNELLIIGQILSGLIFFTSMFVPLYAKKAVFESQNKLSAAMRQLADGDLTTTIPGLERKDEIGDMAKAVQVFKENAIEMEHMEVETEKAKVRAASDKQTAMNKLADDFDARISAIIMSLSTAAEQMQTTATTMNNASERTSEISSAVAAAAAEADANVQTVAAATEELSASSQEIAQQINMVASMSTNAAMEAETTSSEVKNLQAMAISVGDVVSAIKDIADQTNLLALNATIEAARAGEAGKGFAVVADEVKKLANETAQKTEEIDERVTRIQNAINSSVQAMDKIINNVKNIDHATTSVTAAVEEQNAATGEIGRNVAEASTGTQQVSMNIVKVQENAQETGVASRTVLEAAGELSNLSHELKEQVSGILTEIRNSGKEQDKKKSGNVVTLAVAAE